MASWRGRARRTGHWAGTVGRRAGVLRHRPERWTLADWNAAYQSGQLAYYGGLDELARYSIVAGYVGWFIAAAPGRQPRVLDVGCGTGVLRERLEGAPVSEYVGVDLSAAAIREASARGYSRSRFVVGDVLAADLEPFDVVVLNELLYYVSDTAAFLKRIREILQPGGLLVVSMWRHPGDRSLWRTIEGAFPIVDRVEVRNRANSINRRGWMIGCFRSAGDDGLG